MNFIRLAVIALIVALGAAAKAQHHHHPSDPPSTHGMLVTGKSQVLLSHLPMFHNPHDYQVLLEADFGAAAETYFASREDNPAETVYTLVPETFVLPEMIANPRPFQASLYRGHFERGGKQIVAKFTVTIKKVIYFEKLDAKGARPKNLTYVLFGTPGDAYVAHVIAARPDFDHVVAVKLTDAKIAQLLSENGTVVVAAKGIAKNEPLAAGNVTVTLPDGSASVLEGLVEQYLEFGDLEM